MEKQIQIGIIVGSKSDLSVMDGGCDLLKTFEIPYSLNIVSAHRTPSKMYAYAQQAHKNGYKVIIAGAGGAAHLPGMVASITPLPVIGVPILCKNSLGGLDSVLSILQMPKGVPVATVALNNGQNAALLAVKILALNNINYLTKLMTYQREIAQQVENDDLALQEKT